MLDSLFGRVLCERNFGWNYSRKVGKKIKASLIDVRDGNDKCFWLRNLPIEGLKWGKLIDQIKGNGWTINMLNM